MAGDWLKVEASTPDKPEIWSVASVLNIDPDAAFGKLFRVWAWFDQHTEDGNAPTVTKMLLDRIVGVTGFCDAVISSGWMLEDEHGISLPNFDRHNGKTAKNRATTAKRVAKHKKSNAKGNGNSNEGGNGEVTPPPLPREEKRRDTTTLLSARDPNDIPSHQDWQQHLIEHGFQLHHLQNPKMVQGLRRWHELNATVQDGLDAIKAADAKIGGLPARPEYYLGFIDDVLIEKQRASDTPLGGSNGTGGKSNTGFSQGDAVGDEWERQQHALEQQQAAGNH